MIILQVEGMCQTCPNFDAVSDTSILYGDNAPLAVEHTVKCSRRQECENIRRFLERVLDDEDKKKASGA